jgi:hypothetical protein
MPADALEDLDSRRARAGFWLLIAAIAMIGVGKAVLSDTLDPDLFWHLRVAEQLRADGIGPLIDHLSFNSIRQPWTPYSWLAELAMKSLWDAGGYRATIGVYAALVALLLIFNALSCSALAGEERRLCAVVGTLLTAYLSFPFLSFRPVTIAIVLLAACAWLIFRDRRRGERSRAVWLLIPLTALISNIHLCAIIIPIWTACLLAGSILERRRAVHPARSDEVPRGRADGRSIRRYALLLAATFLAALATPMLPGAARAAWHYQFGDVMVASRVIAEMQPIYRGRAAILTITLLLFVAFCAIRNRDRLRAGEWFMLAAGAALLLRLGRFAPIGAMVAGPVLAATMPTLSDKALRHRLVWAALALAILACSGQIIAGFPRAATSMNQWINRRGPDFPGYPVGAADFVDHNVVGRNGRIINEFNAGGYLEWRFAGRYQTLLDGRTQLFPREFWDSTYLGTETQQAQVVTRANADAAIIPARRSLFRESLIRLGWRSVFKDDFGEVFLPPESEAKR